MRGVHLIGAALVAIAMPAEAARLVCASVDYGYNHCPAAARGSVNIVQQLSRAPCVQGRSWGTDRNGIWVSNGCAATFRTTSGGDVAGAAVVGGIVGALLGSAASSNSGYYRRQTSNYWLSPSDPRIPDEPAWATRQRARDIADQADDERQRRAYLDNQQYQRDLQDRQDRETEANQRAAYEANQQNQRDIQDAQDDTRQRNAYQANQDQQTELETRQNIQQGEEDELRQAREAGESTGDDGSGGDSSEETPS